MEKYNYTDNDISNLKIIINKIDLAKEIFNSGNFEINETEFSDILQDLKKFAKISITSSHSQLNVLNFVNGKIIFSKETLNKIIDSR